MDSPGIPIHTFFQQYGLDMFNHLIVLLFDFLDQVGRSSQEDIFETDDSINIRGLKRSFLSAHSESLSGLEKELNDKES